MGLKQLDLVIQRVEQSRSESTSALFDDLLHLGEAFLKTYTGALVAGLPDERNRHRYRLCHKLVRAAGLGEWDEVLADASTGPASQHLLSGASAIQQELAQRYRRGSWPFDAAALLHRCLVRILPNVERLPTKVDGRRWFGLFVHFRNKTKGHGAQTHQLIKEIIDDFESSIRLYLDNSVVPRLEWAYIKRNLSGKFHVVSLSDSTLAFDYLKSTRTISIPNGIYIDFGRLSPVELIDTNVDVIDFHFPNGHFRGRNCEWISYITGTVKKVDGTAYLKPATALPASSTEGERALDLIGRCFSNLPSSPSDYVPRRELETELTEVLTIERHPIVTLVGRGGIGKTSLAIHVLHELSHTADVRFFGILWFSARDIDLLREGPKLVKPSILTTKEIARKFIALVESPGWKTKGIDAKDYMEKELGHSKLGPLLIVFDNFETIQQPIDVYMWLDTYIRSPNKILITTRHREFRGDYPVEVGGMTESECDKLVNTTAHSLEANIPITSQFRKRVYEESEGHPYVVKMLVGEARDGQFQKIERVFASRDDLLDALFERTYAHLSPAAKLVFLTLSNWRSLVAQVALDAVLLRPEQDERIDTRAALDELRQVSFVDEQISQCDDGVFLSVPLVASVFGRRKLSVSPDRIEIESSMQFLYRFGAMQASDLKRGLRPRISRFLGSLSDDLAKGTLDLSSQIPILDLIARAFPRAWIMIADLWEETGYRSADKEIQRALTRYLEMTTPNIDQLEVWDRIARIAMRKQDWIGFVDAQVHIAELIDADISTISAAVNTFNSVSRYLESDLKSKRRFAARLAAVMEPKIGEGDARDCSRLAWALIQSGRTDRAEEIVARGLRLDPSNEYCLKLSDRLSR